ncbi:MAG TPA: proprotein convertase P-domain-containing protein [Ignavibacteria bacterium]|nr:proprotein convertase P-domain-containing protein [Ignavibacteria bacterium]
MFTSIDNANEPVPMSQIVFNLDGYCEASSENYAKLNFRNDARFSHPGTLANQPVSPPDRSDAVNFTKGYLQKKSDRLIPASGTSGLMTDDTLNIESDQTITDLNLFVAVNHTLSNDLEISLIGPNGDIADVCFDIGQFGTNDNIITIFDDNADSTLVSGKYVSISPRIKPGSSLNAMFAGDNSKGIWRLRINDDNAGNTGRLIGWGIQLNNATFKPALLSANCLAEGFYNETSNTMVRDTMRFNLHRQLCPKRFVLEYSEFLTVIFHRRVYF